ARRDLLPQSLAREPAGAALPQGALPRLLGVGPRPRPLHGPARVLPPVPDASAVRVSQHAAALRLPGDRRRSAAPPREPGSAARDRAAPRNQAGNDAAPAVPGRAAGDLWDMTCARRALFVAVAGCIGACAEGEAGNGQPASETRTVTSFASAEIRGAAT